MIDERIKYVFQTLLGGKLLSWDFTIEQSRWTSDVGYLTLTFQSENDDPLKGAYFGNMPYLQFNTMANGRLLGVSYSPEGICFIKYQIASNNLDSFIAELEKVINLQLEIEFTKALEKELCNS